MKLDNASDLVRKCFSAWETKDREALKELLAEISHLLARMTTTTSASRSIGRSVGREAKRSMPFASKSSLRKAMKPSSAMNAS
jgi:ketosteroid isomerase-like protein